MRSIRALGHPLLLLVLPLVFGLALFTDVVGFKVMAFSGLLFALYGIFVVPVRWSIFFVFAYIGFEGFLKIVSNYNPIVHVGADIMVIALCFKVVLSYYFSGITVPRWPPLTKVFAVHFCWLFVVAFNPYSLSFISSIAGAKIYVSMFLLFFFGYFLTDSEKTVRQYMVLFLGVAVVHSLFGLYPGYVGPDSVLRIHPRYAVQLAKYQHFAFRPFGLTNLPGGPAIFLYPVVPFLLYFLYRTHSTLIRLGILFYVPLAVNLLLLCQVRSAILKAMLAGFLFIAGSMHVASQVSVRWTQRLFLLTGGVALLLLYLLPQFLEYSVEIQQQNEVAIERSLSLFDYETVKNSRRGTMARFMKYAKEVPLGAGFARVGAAAGAFSSQQKMDPFFGYKYFFADNLWVTALVEIGLPGMFFLTTLLVLILFYGLRSYFRLQTISLKMVHLALFSALAAIFVGSYGAEGILYNPEACFFWFFSGVMMKLPTLEEQAV